MTWMPPFSLLRLVGWLWCALFFLLPLLAAAATDPLPPEEAYPVVAYRLNEQTIVVEWSPRPRYYLYRDKIRVLSPNTELKLGTPQLPPGKRKRDDYFGETDIYEERVQITIPVVAPAPEPPWTITVISQGCWSGGVCYPPLEQTLTVADSPPAASSLLDRLRIGAGSATLSVGLANKEETPVPSPPAVSERDPLAAPGGEPTAPSQNSLPAPSAATTATDTGGDEAGQLSRFIAQQNGATVLAAFFGFGLLLAFTPCVFPMIPILSGIIVGQGATLSRARALGLTLIYVLAMALTYALAGVIAGFSGAMVQAALQRPEVLVAFALLFVLLALSLFGFYELQLPASWQSRLNALAGSQQSGQAVGVAVMGILSALIVGPCVAPPLVGALLYISQSGDALFGGAALFMLGLGMGAPLIAVGVGARALLPRSGPWLNRVKEGMGVVLLALAWWIVRPVVAPPLWLAGWGALAVGVAVALGALEPLPQPVRWPRRLAKIVGLLFLLYGAAAVWGSLAGQSDPLQPLGERATADRVAGGEALQWERVESRKEVEALVAASRQPVVVDVRADWCVSCLELEQRTFPHPEVVPLLGQVRRVKVDVTANRPEDRALLSHFGLYGPPAVLFFSPGGSERRELRVTGFVDGPRFAALLRLALSASSEPVTAPR